MRLNKHIRRDQEEIPYVLLWIIILIAILVLISSVGCSATKQVDDKAADIMSDGADIQLQLDEMEQQAIDHAEKVTAIVLSKNDSDKELLEEEENHFFSTKSKISKIKSKASDIVEGASKIRNLLTLVQDKVPMWLKVLFGFVILLGIAGIIWLLERTGVMLLIRKALNMVGMGISFSTREAARFDAERVEDYRRLELTLSRNDNARISARRASDPAYEIAYQQHKKKLKDAAKIHNRKG